MSSHHYATDDSMAGFSTGYDFLDDLTVPQDDFVWIAVQGWTESIRRSLFGVFHAQSLWPYLPIAGSEVWDLFEDSRELVVDWPDRGARRCLHDPQTGVFFSHYV